jgi:hypothetical protein
MPLRLELALELEQTSRNCQLRSRLYYGNCEAKQNEFREGQVMSLSFIESIKLARRIQDHPDLPNKAGKFCRIVDRQRLPG